MSSIILTISVANKNIPAKLTIAIVDSKGLTIKSTPIHIVKIDKSNKYIQPLSSTALKLIDN